LEVAPVTGGRGLYDEAVDIDGSHYGLKDWDVLAIPLTSLSFQTALGEAGTHT